MTHKLDRDPNDALNRMKALPYAVLVVALTAAPAASVAHVAIPVAVMIGVLFGAITYMLINRISGFGSSAIASLYMPAGSSTPPVRQYSLAQSLVARGKYDEAAEAYELLTKE